MIRNILFILGAVAFLVALEMLQPAPAAAQQAGAYYPLLGPAEREGCMFAAKKFYHDAHPDSPTNDYSPVRSITYVQEMSDMDTAADPLARVNYTYVVKWLAPDGADHYVTCTFVDAFRNGSLLAWKSRDLGLVTEVDRLAHEAAISKKKK